MLYKNWQFRGGNQGMNPNIVGLIRNHISKETELISIAEVVTGCSIKLYSVGNGNSSIVTLNIGTEEINILYDFGNCTNHKVENNARKNHNITWNLVQDNLPKIEEIDYVILSHWDLDHINGFSNLNFFENLQASKSLRRIIVPEPISLSIFSERLITNLIGKFGNKLIIIQGDGNSRMMNNNVIVYKGLGGRGSYTQANNIGLSLLIEVNNKKVLLSGDCEYHQIPLDDNNIIDYFIIPHHGANSNELHAISVSQDVRLYSASGMTRNRSGDIAYPNTDIIDYFNEGGRKILSTYSENEFIEIVVQ